MKKLLFSFFLPVLVSICTLTSHADVSMDVYDYPFVNPYEATVLGTPKIYAPDIPGDVRVKELALTVFKDRKIPRIFWYQDRLRCSLASQKEKAPLLINISGTGGSYNSSKMNSMQRVFFNAGFHVLSLSSPTHPNFIVTASESMVPGHIVEDSKDLYRVMELAWEQVKDEIEVSEFYLTGYSLGAAQSAFVSKLDEEKKVFNFKKVLMINPPVNLLSSATLLDRMLEENIPGGLDNFDQFFDGIVNKISTNYDRIRMIDFSDPDALYELYKHDPPPETVMAALIGIAFRLSSGNMIFTSDVMAKNGFIVPADAELTTTTSLTDFAIVTNLTSFADYFNGCFYPYFRSKNSSVTKEGLIKETSLESIEDYLRNSSKIGVVTNEDELILEPDEIDFFRRVFDTRAVIYPKGGHCGNMDHAANVAYMTSFFNK